MRWVRACIVFKEIGITKYSLDKWRYKAVFIEGVHWVKAPDRRIYYNMKEIQTWIES